MKYIFLAKSYDAVVGDTFELFYRGIICLNNPYKYYILVRCDIGNPYNRYFTVTPTMKDVGKHELKVCLLDDEQNVIDEASCILNVHNPVKPNKKLNVLCFGDSLTFNGVWPMEGFRRFALSGGNPAGLDFGNINLIGTCKKELEGHTIGYEGYGSWTWRSFCTTDNVSMNSPIWVNVKEHSFDDSDQHSVWNNAGAEWVLESIEEKRLKFKRGKGNNSPTPKINNVFKHVEFGTHRDDIFIDGYEFEMGNPFWDKDKQEDDFKKYCEKNGFEGIDLVYVLLSWNGQYIPYNTNFDHHTTYARMIFRKIHEAFPNALINAMGIQVCSVNGGIAANYGASGYYSDTFGTISTCFNYNKCLEELTFEDEFKDYVSYVDTKAQFDSEYNMPMVEKKVNVRSNIVEYVGTNGVHPTMDGYLQIGDVFFRSLVKDVIKKNQM